MTHQERCAITTRVSRSFLRVGQFELYGRRARRGETVGLEELELLARHALSREYPEQKLHSADAPLQPQVLAMVGEASHRFATLAAHWIRVGYVQSNFNSDNCLIGGVTVDYGPFGFIERYDPKWGMWIGSGQHFSFLNQPAAAAANFRMFASSLEPLLDDSGKRELRAIIVNHDSISQQAVDAMWAGKLGFTPQVTKQTRGLWRELDALMVSHPTDYHKLYRQLSVVLDAAGSVKDADGTRTNDGLLVAPLTPAFFQPPPLKVTAAYAEWIRKWIAALRDAGRESSAAASSMRATNPKFVPREWMLVEAYTAADQRGDGLHPVSSPLVPTQFPPVSSRLVRPVPIPSRPHPLGLGDHYSPLLTTTYCTLLTHAPSVLLTAHYLTHAPSVLLTAHYLDTHSAHPLTL